MKLIYLYLATDCFMEYVTTCNKQYLKLSDIILNFHVTHVVYAIVQDGDDVDNIQWSTEMKKLTAINGSSLTWTVSCP